MAARRERDFHRASRLYEEAALASIQRREPPGLAAANYVEAANCAEADLTAAEAEAAVAAAVRARVVDMLEKAAAQFGKTKRPNQSADIYKRLAILAEDELQSPDKACKYLELASTDYDAANFTNNAIDCDLRRAELVYPDNPLQSLEIFKSAAAKLLKKQQLALAKPVVHKIVLLTASLYDTQTARKTADSYQSTHKGLQLCIELRRDKIFLEALELEDIAVVSDLIEETNNPWAKELMTKIKNDSFLSDELDLT